MNKSAIVYLLNNNQKDISNFRHSISLLYNNYYKSFPCDIICFYEKDFPEEELEYLKNALSILKVSFVNIDFEMPNFYSQETLQSIPQYYPHPDFPQANGFSIGYRHMCRFFAGDIFNYPIIQKYKYIWRLDTDSFILSPIIYNVFEKLNKNNCIYGYINIQHDHPGVIKNLWETTEQYFKNLNKDQIFSSDNKQFHKNRVFYTNFEIFDIEWFRQKEYQDYFNFIDRSAGIYKYRWGDHSIRYIGVNSIAKEDQIYFYNDIEYFHQQKYLNNKITDSFNEN
jgi:alpha 1,2-mannosyltransferase